MIDPQTAWETVAKATIVLIAACAVRLALGRAAAAARQLLWTLTLLAILGLPLASISLRPLHWTAAPVRVSPAVKMPAIAAALETASNLPAPFPWAALASILYLAGLAAVAGRFLVGLTRITLMTWRAKPFDGCPVTCPRGIEIRVGQGISLPVAWGWRRPVILLPVTALEWNLDRLRLVLAHECAHIRRWDYLGQIAAQSACALYWFHPLAWWAKKQLVRERETACDDEVLNMGFKATDYAQHLLEIVRAQRQKTSLSPAVGMAEASHLERRLKDLLDPCLNRRAPARWIVVVAVLASCSVLGPLAAIHAQAGSGALSGVVRDPSGAVVPHALITAVNSDARNVEVAYSGPDGSYQLNRLPAGHYSLEVKSRGFAPLVQKDIAIPAGGTVQYDPKINVGGIQEAVEVVGQRSSSAAMASNGTPQRIRVGGNVQASKLLTKVNPVYPANALRNNVQGTVVLKAVIGTDGRLLSLVSASSSPDPELSSAALDAVRLWTYEPTLLNGEPVEVVTTIAVTFRLE